MTVRGFAIVSSLALMVSACGGGGGAGSAPAPTTAPTTEPTTGPSANPSGKITHIVIVVQENRSPDNLFHGLPGADIATSGQNSSGQTVPLVPVSLTADYDIDHRHSPSFLTEYNGGKMNGFNNVTFGCGQTGCAKNPTAYGYVPAPENAPYMQMAEQYTFADRMFQTNAGPSLPAHMYILSGNSAVTSGSSLYVAENPAYANGNKGNCDGDPQTTVDLIDINTGSESSGGKPCIDHPTMFEALDARGVSYRYYTSMSTGLWVAPDMFSQIRSGPDWSHVSIGNANVLTDIANGQLQAVSWVIPTAAESDHAGINDGTGPSWVSSVVNAIGNSPYWSNTVIFVTWDDWGGWYDHVAPHQYNAYELGFRVPLIVISPYAKAGYVSHVPHEFGSILHFTEETFGLNSLGSTDARADDLSDCFDFTQTPIAFRTISAARKASYFLSLPPDRRSPDDDF